MNADLQTCLVVLELKNQLSVLVNGELFQASTIPTCFVYNFKTPSLKQKEAINYNDQSISPKSGIVILILLFVSIMSSYDYNLNTRVAFHVSLHPRNTVS